MTSSEIKDLQKALCSVGIDLSETYLESYAIQAAVEVLGLMKKRAEEQEKS